MALISDLAFFFLSLSRNLLRYISKLLKMELYHSWLLARVPELAVSSLYYQHLVSHSGGEEGVNGVFPLSLYPSQVYLPCIF